MNKGTPQPKQPDGHSAFLVKRSSRDSISEEVLIDHQDEWDFSQVSKEEKTACCLWELYRENKTFMREWSKEDLQVSIELNLEKTLLEGSQFIDPQKAKLNFHLSWIPYRVARLVTSVELPLCPWVQLSSEERDTCREKASCPGIQILPGNPIVPWFDSFSLSNSTHWYERFQGINDGFAPKQIMREPNKPPPLPFLTEVTMVVNTLEYSREKLIEEFAKWLDALPDQREPKTYGGQGRQKKQTELWLDWISASRLLEIGIEKFDQLPDGFKQRFSKTSSLTTGTQSFEKFRNKARKLAYDLTVPDCHKLGFASPQSDHE